MEWGKSQKHRRQRRCRGPLRRRPHQHRRQHSRVHDHDMVVNGFELFVDFCRPLRFCIIVVVCIVSFCVRRFLHGGILMENNSLRPTHRRHWINAKRVDDDGDNGDDDVDDEVDEFAFACAYAFYAVFAKVMAIPMGACPDTLHCARHVLSYPMHINARVDDDSSDGNDGDDDYDGVDDDVGRR